MNVGSWYGKQGDLTRAMRYSEQALDMSCELFGERHATTLKTSIQVAIILIRSKRSSEAYHLVLRFLKRPRQMGQLPDN